jgi:hypothetical protein
MTWEQRGKKRYYYRNQWRDGRSVRTYFGTGEAAELAATAEALQRVQREKEARQRRQEQERRAAAEALLVELCEKSDVLVHATLIVAGYHQHDRGTWRRKREREPADGET